MILWEYCSKLSENIRKIRGGKLTLLPLVDKETIKKIIIKYDELFIKSIVKSQNFEDFIDKISCNANVISVCINGQVAGYCAYYMNDFESREAYITLIAVDEDFQANHLGTIMLDYIKAVAVINGFICIRLEVHDNNVRAIRFYEHNNFCVEMTASKDSKYMRCNL